MALKNFGNTTSGSSFEAENVVDFDNPMSSAQVLLANSKTNDAFTIDGVDAIAHDDLAEDCIALDKPKFEGATGGGLGFARNGATEHTPGAKGGDAEMLTAFEQVGVPPCVHASPPPIIHPSVGPCMHARTQPSW